MYTHIHNYTYIYRYNTVTRHMSCFTVARCTACLYHVAVCRNASCYR